MQPLDAARRIAAEEFPSAEAVFLGRSVLGLMRNATSDLDLLVVLSDSRAPTLQRVRRHGWPVELFVHTRASLRQHWAVDVKVRRQALLRVAAEGVCVLADTAVFAALQQEARLIVRSGPRALEATELEQRRFVISDLLDDLVGCTVRSELTYIANALLTQVANLALMAGGHWSGSSKWLGRELTDFDPGLAAELDVAHRRAVGDGKPEDLGRVCRRVLDSLGGPFPPHFFAGLDPAPGQS